MLNAVIAKHQSKQAAHSLGIFLLTFDLCFNAFTHQAIWDYFVTALKNNLQSRD